MLRLVIRQSMIPVLAGGVLGAACAPIVGSLGRSWLYGVFNHGSAAFSGAASSSQLTKHRKGPGEGASSASARPNTGRSR